MSTLFLILATIIIIFTLYLTGCGLLTSAAQAALLVFGFILITLSVAFGIKDKIPRVGEVYMTSPSENPFDTNYKVEEYRILAVSNGYVLFTVNGKTDSEGIDIFELNKIRKQK